LIYGVPNLVGGAEKLRIKYYKLEGEVYSFGVGTQNREAKVHLSLQIK